MTISIIVAVAENGVIGDKNSLLWHISEDLKRFKRLTSGHTVVMGRKTFESIGRPLPQRRNIVISRQTAGIEGCEVCRSVEEVLRATTGEEEVFIIGGAEIYRQFLPLADRFYLTKVMHAYEGDTSFPEWNPAEWTPVGEERHARGEHYEWPFVFCDYERHKI